MPRVRFRVHTPAAVTTRQALPSDFSNRLIANTDSQAHTPLSPKWPCAACPAATRTPPYH